MLEDRLACLPAGGWRCWSSRTPPSLPCTRASTTIKRMLAAGKPVGVPQTADHGAAHAGPGPGKGGGGPVCGGGGRSAAGVKGAARSGERHNHPLARHSRACQRFGLALRFRLRPAFVSQPTASVASCQLSAISTKILQNLLKRGKRPGIIERKWTRAVCPLRGIKIRRLSPCPAGFFRALSYR